jgi:DNA-binding NtrC family response regulator
VRIVAATNRDLRSAMEQGRFRSDLYFRFRVGIHLPPLRERREDLDRYIDNALTEVAQRHGIVKTVSSALRAFLHGYDFPGNLRELHNLIEQMAVMSDGCALELEHLPEHLSASLVACAPPACELAPGAAPGMLKEIEWRTIVEALRLEQGNRSRAARRLGISRKTLYRRLVGGEHER